jgi:hypothetical protein
MKKIQCVSKLFAWLFIIIFALLPTLVVVFWINAPTPISFVGTKTGFFVSFIPKGITILHPLSAQTKQLGFLVSLIPLTVNLFILYFLIKLFRQFSRGDIFSVSNITYIKRIGYTLLIGQLLGMIHEGLMSAVLTWHNPPGHRMIGISLSGTNIGILLMALLIILIAWIMTEGNKLKEEQEYTI